MPEYEVLHRLGVYINGLGSRPQGGVFVVSAENATRLQLDDNPNLKRVDAKPTRKSTPQPKPESDADTQEG